ncbi:MAG: thermonuclease family protein [Actinomycetia bacterium]|nr:thermonuclease family protein [Actinomycetes bacterium]
MTSLKSGIISIIPLLLIVLLLSSCGLAYNAEQPAGNSHDGLYEVSKVIDGDTLIVKNGKRVRLIGINTPEKGQYFYQESRQVLKAMVGGQQLTLERDVSETDQYGRWLRYVYVGDLFVNLEMVKRGFAHAYTYPPDVMYQQLLVEAQSHAQKNNLGLWQKTDVSLEISINYDAPGNDNENINEEYVVITSTSDEPVDLSGYTIKDSGTNIFKFPRLLLDRGEKVFIYSGKGNQGEGKLFWGSDTPIWNNSGDTLYLRNTEGLLVDIYSY